MAKRKRSKTGKPPPNRRQTPSHRATSAPASNEAAEGVLWPVLSPARSLPILALQPHFEQSQWWTPKRLLHHQMAQIQSLVEHAHVHVPFYRDRLNDVVGLPPRSLTMEAFRQVPVLKRTDIQDAGAAMVTRKLPRRHGEMFNIRTSGSTGRPLEMKGTDVTGLFYRAIGLRGELWHRRDLYGKLMAIRSMHDGKTMERWKNWAPAMPTGPGVQYSMALPVATLFEKLLDEDPTYLQSLPSTLREMIRLSQETGRKPAGLRGVKTESETVEPDLRDLCAREWGVRIVDVYSCQEANIIAIECPHAPHYHVQSECCLIEILDNDDRPCAPGQLGRVVVTSLHNFATPLIRYELGDYAAFGEQCPCGRGLPVLARIAGRQRHLAVLPSGEKVTLALNFERVLNDLPIRQFQLIQKSLDEVEARLVVKRPMTGGEERQLAAYFNRGFGHEFPFTFVYVEDIPRLPSGKFEIFRSEVET